MYHVDRLRFSNWTNLYLNFMKTFKNYFDYLRGQHYIIFFREFFQMLKSIYKYFTIINPL